jgi:hypothetical protein
MQITKRSPFTNKLNTVDVPITQEQYITYKEGISAELVFPELSREYMLFIKYGISPSEHANLVKTYVEANQVAFDSLHNKKVAIDVKPEIETTEGIVFPN